MQLALVQFMERSSLYDINLDYRKFSEGALISAVSAELVFPLIAINCFDRGIVKFYGGDARVHDRRECHIA